MNKTDIEALNEAYQDINDLVAKHYTGTKQWQRATNHPTIPPLNPKISNTATIYPVEINKLLEKLITEMSNGAYLEMGPDEINSILKRAIFGAYDIAKK